MRNLTQLEQGVLEEPLNLADGHAYRQWTASEQDTIARAGDLLQEVDRQCQSQIEDAYLAAFFDLAQQSLRTDHFRVLHWLTASMAIEAVANYCRVEGLGVSLIEPCFDNLADILRRHRLHVIPIDERILTLVGPELDEALDGMTSEVVFLVSPNNPTGASLRRESLRQVAAHCYARGKTLVIDSCFRFYLPADEVYDQYAVLADSGVDCIVIEDTGKTWPTVELKAPFLVASPRLADALADIHSDFLLHVSPFTLRLLTEFVSLAKAEGLAHTRDIVTRNREALRDVLRGTNLSATEADFISFAWLRINGQDNSVTLCERLAQAGVYVLPGCQFYWSNPDCGQRYLRVALARDPTVFTSAARRMGSVLRLAHAR
jgi:aspartate/methionine/tyrosine aminotransferase